MEYIDAAAAKGPMHPARYTHAGGFRAFPASHLAQNQTMKPVAKNMALPMKTAATICQKNVCSMLYLSMKKEGM